MRAILFIFLLIFVSCGDEMGKPTREFKFDTTKANIEPIGNAREVSGYGEREVISYKNLNDMMSNISDWALYLSRMAGKTYYVDNSDGSDTAEGTETAPFLTLPRAIEMIEENGVGNIILNRDGIYYIDRSVSARNKKIKIYQNAGINATVEGVSYLSSTNKLYQIQLENSVLLIGANTLKIPAPIDPSKNWSASNTALINCEGGNNVVSIAAYSGFEITDTAATGGYPALVRQAGESFLNMFLNGNFVTNDKGALLDQGSDYAPHAVLSTSNYTIDNEVWESVSSSEVTNQILSTGDMLTTVGAFKIKIDSVLTTNETGALPEDLSDAYLEDAIETLLNSALRGYIISVDVTTERTALGAITKLDFEINSYNGMRLPMPVFFVGTQEGVFHTIQEPRKAKSNIIRNKY